jgi:hypothetical protein
LATVLGFSVEVPCAGLGGLSPGNSFTLIISLTFNVHVNNEIFGAILGTFSVGFEHKVVTFISLSRSVEVVGREFSMMEYVFAGISIGFISLSISSTKTKIRGRGL